MRAAAVALLALCSATAAADDTAFSLSSANLRDGGTVPAAQLFDQGDCRGGNRSPQLSWRNPPAGTRGFAVSVFDPDAPGRGWWHWFVAGLPADTRALPENASAAGLPARRGATEARNDFGTPGYGGPCPPPGPAHRYVVTIYALRHAGPYAVADTAPSAAALARAIAPDTLAQASLTVRYGR